MSELKTVTAEAAPKAIGPYSLGVWAGDLLFISGQTPTDPATGQIVTGTVADHARQTIKNVAAVLEAAGLSLADVVKTTLFIKNMDDFATINEVYAGFFKPPYPARSTVEVARLPKDVLVEIEAVARKRG